ncbi:phospholipase D family protein [Burkholderia vietnamiensis]|uniref:phospholipase D family nuclease n=1 Tax=Burkholderia vietnamiensis TaxID=60552 RepID=UPI001BA3994E|nr:phospholipase D family protein [Burkholderia vietnamiensis]MBR8034651.1 phospholipase D family protein [Burkholderia vietnamiensis]
MSRIEVARREPDLNRVIVAGLIAFAIASVQPARAATTCAVDVGYSPEGTAEHLVMTSIERARQSVRLAAYTFTSAAVSRALVGAKRRGIDVAVLADAKESAKRTQQAALNVLVQAGIPTRTISAYAIHHDKFIVIDGVAVETGSFNFSAAAASRNSENALLLTGCPDLARSYLNHWQSRWNQGADYTLAY